MFVSVIIPTYNRAHLVTDAIYSVLAQTYTNFELLVIDDHSTDDTEAIVKGYDDPRVIYMLNNRKKGAQGARNTGLFAAKGEWVAMLDSDDAWLPGKLERMAEKIRREDDTLVGISSANAAYDFEEQKIIREKRLKEKEYTTKDLLYRNYLDGFSSFMFKRTAGLEAGGFDESLPALQDIDFYIAISIKGKIIAVNEVLTLIRKSNDDRITFDNESKFNAHHILKNKYKNERKNKFLISARRQCVSILFAQRAGKPYKIHFSSLFIMLFFDPALILKITVKFVKQV